MTFSALVDTEFALSMISREQFIEYHAEVNNDKCMDIEEHFRLTDDEAKALISKIAKCKSASEFQELDTKTRNACIYKLHSRGLSIRQMSRKAPKRVPIQYLQFAGAVTASFFIPIIVAYCSEFAKVSVDYYRNSTESIFGLF